MNGGSHFGGASGAVIAVVTGIRKLSLSSQAESAK